eukprot:2615569-Rhodomonas_salina.1
MKIAEEGSTMTGLHIPMAKQRRDSKCSSDFRIQGWNLGFRIWSLEFRLWGIRRGGQAWRCRPQASSTPGTAVPISVQARESRVWGLESRV